MRCGSLMGIELFHYAVPIHSEKQITKGKQASRVALPLSLVTNAFLRGWNWFGNKVDQRFESPVKRVLGTVNRAELLTTE